jgi:hypothetical protein
VLIVIYNSSGQKCLFDNMLIISVLFDIMLGGHCLIMLMLRNFLDDTSIFA